MYEHIGMAIECVHSTRAVNCYLGTFLDVHIFKTMFVSAISQVYKDQPFIIHVDGRRQQHHGRVPGYHSWCFIKFF